MRGMILRCWQGSHKKTGLFHPIRLVLINHLMWVGKRSSLGEVCRLLEVEGGLVGEILLERLRCNFLIKLMSLMRCRGHRYVKVNKMRLVKEV